MKHILFISNKFPYPERDGGAIATMGMIRGFKNQGHKITLLGMNTFKHFTHLRNLPYEIRQLGNYYVVHVDIRIKKLPALSNLLFSKKPYHLDRFYSHEFENQIVSIMRGQKFDLIQIEGLYLGRYISAIRKMDSNVPVVMRAHNLEHEIWLRQAQQAKPGFRKKYLEETARRIRAYEEKIYAEKLYDAIVPITQRDKDSIINMGASCPVHVSQAGVNFSLFPKPKPELAIHPNLFYIGALDWTPNQNGLRWFLEKVWPQLHSMYPKLEFYIAGRRMSSEFMSLRTVGIKVLGEVEDAYKFMQQHSIMVSPLFEGGGMRVKIVEGMALGKAIVATSIAAEGINVRHGHDILIADDAEAYVNCVASLIENKGLAEVLGSRAHKMIQKEYDSMEIAADLLDFYAETFWKDIK